MVRLRGSARFTVSRSTAAGSTRCYSRVNIVPPTEAIVRHASRLLAAAGLHGHKYAIVAATRTRLTRCRDRPDVRPEDLHMLCAPTSA